MTFIVIEVLGVVTAIGFALLVPPIIVFALQAALKRNTQ